MQAVRVRTRWKSRRGLRGLSNVAAGHGLPTSIASRKYTTPQWGEGSESLSRAVAPSRPLPLWRLAPSASARSSLVPAHHHHHHHHHLATKRQQNETGGAHNFGDRPGADYAIGKRRKGLLLFATAASVSVSVSLGLSLSLIVNPSRPMSHC